MVEAKLRPRRSTKEAPYLTTLKVVAETDGLHCAMCRSRVSVNERPLSDAERELGWPNPFAGDEAPEAGNG